METKNKNNLMLITGALILGGFVISPPGRRLISWYRLQMMNPRERYAYFWNLTKQGLYTSRQGN